jgi:hypothetical protein
MVLYDSLPRPRRSISTAAALEDKCDNSRRTGSSSLSRAAAAAAFFAASLLTEEPSFLPRVKSVVIAGLRTGCNAETMPRLHQISLTGHTVLGASIRARYSERLRLVRAAALPW